ncbi:S1 family peptidase [Nonomuraea aridisoli]|uniref:S1 family peptidase n=2 Tax=Bacteria TaxID=2 RepID=UPI0011B93B87|nr:S1 family peptidase [Nonomuraea aridisoli]
MSSSGTGGKIGPEGRLAIKLDAQDQPKLEHPAVEKILAEAKVRGIPPANALKSYALELVKRNPEIEGSLPDGPVPDPDIEIDGIPYAELIDLDRFAKSNNMDLAETISRYSWAPRINPIAAQLRSEHAAEIADIAIIDDGKAVRMGFKGEVPDKAVELAKTLPVEVFIYADKGFSEVELEAAKRSAHDEVLKRNEVAAVASSYDAEKGLISIRVRPKEIPKTSADTANLEASIRPTQPSNPVISVSVSIDEELEIRSIDQYLRGGGVNTPKCTNGFNIINSSTDARETLQARHCADELYLIYHNHSDYDGNTTTMARNGRATEFDLARYQGGGLTRTRTFYYDWNLPRYAHDVGTSPVIGQPICKFGKTTGATCDAITALNVDLTSRVGDGQTWRGNIETDRISDRGDSGGPAYYGNRAWGISSADSGTCSLCDTATWFVAVDRVNDPGGFGANWNVWVCSTC